MNTLLTIRKAVLLLPVLGLLGCSSIHSTAVRKLITKESEKLDTANQAATKFVAATKARTDAMTNALDSLDTAMKKQNTAEMMHALIFSANQNIASKQGVDAHSATYMIGKLYLTEQAGLEKAVDDQFLADITALQNQAVRIQQSWASLKTLQQKVAAFAAKSSFASVDPDFIAALGAEIPGASAELNEVLTDSQTLNDMLKTALGFVPVKGANLGAPQSQLNELIDLLERVKASPKPATP